MVLNCLKCKKDIHSKRNLTCSKCNQTFHIVCANLSLYVFNKLTSVQKTEWKCTTCKTTSNDSSVSSALDNLTTVDTNSQTPQKNVCQERKFELNIPTENSFESLSVHSLDLNEDEKRSSTLESTSFMNRSYPDIRPNLDEKVIELERVIIKLQEKLLIAENEIENLVVENNTLKKKISSQETKVNQLKHICKSTPKAKVNKKNKNDINADNLSLTSLSSTPLLKVPELTSHKRPEKEPVNSDVQLLELPHDGSQEKYTQKLHLPDEKQIKDTHKEFKNTFVKKTYTANKNKNKIIIIGDQQATGVASTLISLRSRYTNPRKYDICGAIYPQAPTSYILDKTNLTKMDLNEDDWVILCIGSNDCNPTLLFVEISALLKYLKKPKIILTSVVSNRYLNISKLNSQLKTLLNCFKNCTYVNINLSKISNLMCDEVTTQINLAIDKKDYNAYYLQLRRNGFEPLKKNNLKQTTIPHYFSKIAKTNKTGKTISNLKSLFFRG